MQNNRYGRRQTGFGVRIMERYRLTPEEIYECCREGYALGFRTFVLQGARKCCWWMIQITPWRN